MANYQYDTNPRKIDTSYKKKTKENLKNKKQVTHKKKAVTKAEVKAKREKQKALNTKIQVSIGIKVIAILAIFFVIIFRETQISEKFSTIQGLKTSITELQKENDQLEISIQNSLNLNNIEQVAKELLGMQKLTTKQKVYISLDKEDYVEHKTEEVVIEDTQSNFFENIINKIKNIFE